MEKITYKLIMPTFSKYLDITASFLELLAINWPESKKHVVISVVDNQQQEYSNFKGFEILKNKVGTTLPGCVVNVVKRYKADYYFSFLGDAFISKKISNKDVDNLLIELYKNNIEYCRLKPQKVMNAYPIGKMLRSINTNERYSHSFVAFAATSEFILREFQNNMTDRDFEVKYLKLALQNKNEIIPNRVVLKKNIFHILPSIQKGEWDLFAITFLRAKYPQIEFNKKRKSIGIIYELILLIGGMILPVMPNKLRIKIKKKLNKTGFFDTEI